MGRAPCCDKAKVRRGPWSPEEDETLKNYVEKFGTGGNWIALPRKAGLKRCGKSCRLRWLNYLRPHIKRGRFTEEEDDIIISLFGKIGSRWSVIASKLPGRTDNDVKNHWNTKLKKQLFGGNRSQSSSSSKPNNNHETLSINAPNSNNNTIIYNPFSTPLPSPYNTIFPIDDPQLLFPSSSTFLTENTLLTTSSTTTIDNDHYLTTNDHSTTTNNLICDPIQLPPQLRGYQATTTASCSPRKASRLTILESLPSSLTTVDDRHKYLPFSSIEDDNNVLLGDLGLDFSFEYDHLHGNEVGCLSFHDEENALDAFFFGVQSREI
ncbi:hypothetical protein Ancab_002063 [Ancistrocladus abbreviatus]